MKKVRFFLSIAVVVALMTACNQNVENAKSIAQLTENDVPISRIDPTDWYVGLKNPSLQLMVYGEGIRDAEVSVSGAKIDSLVRLDSPNYLLVYLNVKGCKAGTLPLTFTLGEKQTTIAYELKQRDMAGDDAVKIRLNVLAASSLITSAVIAYKRLHPEISFDLIQNESSSLYDVGVFTFADADKAKPDDDEVTRLDEEIFLAVPNGERYRKLDHISLRQMEGEKFIGLAGTKQLRSICNEFCRGLGVRTDISFESDNTSAIKDAVAAGIGVCFWPEFTWGHAERRKIRLLKIVDAPFRRDLLVTLRRNKADNRNTENFYTFLVTFLRRHFRHRR